MDLDRSKDHPRHMHQGMDFVPVHQAQERERRQSEFHGHGHDHDHDHDKDQVHQGLPHEHPAPVQSDAHLEQGLTIYIDHKPYSSLHIRLTGADIRALANPAIGADKPLFRVVAGQGGDIKVGDADIVEINPHEATHGRHFYSVSQTCIQAPQVPVEEIAKEAYFLYLQQGSPPGHDVENWLQAEARLTVRAQKGSFA